MNILTFTTLYPNATQPLHGIFVEARLAHLVASGQVFAKVVAPIPYVPNLGVVPARYRMLAGAPRCEHRSGIEVFHPRYPVLPKIGMTAAPILLYQAVARFVQRRLRQGLAFDLIDAHYFYPDGVAAALLACRLGKPLVITARGTDINLIPRHRAPRAMIRWAARQAAGIITVCSALKDQLVALGTPAEKIRVLRNGVDLAFFKPCDRTAARARFGVDGRVLASVGHLIERKGHDLVISALPALPGTTLLIVGEGPERANLHMLALRKGVADRVRFLGAVPQSDLPPLYSAADVLVLASSREGWANVLLEAMACGTPVVASNVWGTPEVVTAPEAGELMATRTSAAIVQAVDRLFARMPPRAAVRAYAAGFSWDETTRGQIELFAAVMKAPRDEQAIETMPEFTAPPPCQIRH